MNIINFNNSNITFHGHYLKKNEDCLVMGTNRTVSSGIMTGMSLICVLCESMYRY